MEFHLLNSSQVDWGKLDKFEDRLVYQTREWIEFVADTQKATPVVAALQDGSTTVGYFSGLIFKRAGIRILGSPFPGWTTPSMGFNLVPGVPRWQAFRALERLAFQELRCLHLEVADRYSSVEDGMKLGFSSVTYDCVQTNLAPCEETLFRSFNDHCRRNLRRGEKNGIWVEEANDEQFADDYYDQVKQVFARQKLVPTYNRERVRRLIHHLLPTGRLLLLRVRDREERCIATGIYAAINKSAEYWGSASFQSTRYLKPNEAIHWYAIRYWKRHGMQRLCWGPKTAFKEKFGVETVPIQWFRKSRFAFIDGFRQYAKSIFEFKQNVMGYLHGHPEVREKAD